jgi:hypothetical protein
MPEKPRSPLPARAVLRPEGMYLALRDIAAGELRDAFMQETVARVPALESFVQVERRHLGQVAPGSAPAGIVFHVARCGSTLVSQALKQHERCVVYSEPLPCNELLLPPHAYPRHELVAALRSLGEAFAGHAGRPYVLKLSSWNTLFCDVVADAFPGTPWVLTLRDPVEVGVSLLERPAGWMQGNAGAAAVLRRTVDPAGDAQTPEEFVARLFGAFCAAASQLDPARGRLLDYADLPAAIWTTVAPHFGLAVDDAQLGRMLEVARIDAKAPVGKTTAFARDDQSKQAAASAALRAAVMQHAVPELQRLRQRF